MQEYSQSKALFHLDKLQSLQQNRPIAPTEIQVDLEAWCNDNCSFCAYRIDEGPNNRMLDLIDAKPGKKYDGDKPVGSKTKQSGWDLSWSDELPKQMVAAGIKAIEITGGGESTLWPRFDRLLYNLGEADRDVALVTNGSNLSDKRIDLICKYCQWVRISMDASSGIIHKKVHRTTNYDFERRLDNLRKLIKYKSDKLIIGISFIINQNNFEDIEDSARLYESLGVDNIRFSWMYDSTGTSGLSAQQITEVKSLLDRLQKELHIIHYDDDRVDQYSQPNTDFKTCHYQRFVWAIGADMKLYPCCIQKYDPKNVLGDLRKNTLKELIALSHEKMTALTPRECLPCWIRNKNKIIDQAVNEPTHSNFI